MTIHTGVGCSYGCVYCYIWDMGFPGYPAMYPLTPLQLAYALAINPYVLPRSTMAAYGSVTEPFLPETRDRALEYVKTIYEWLKLPSQVSTKSILDDE
ncbi:MAG: radical SAM protein, partial [Desulfurococcales archaeon]|nr:radical SAM protein [Desulfurococcales archaeon]